MIKIVRVGSPQQPGSHREYCGRSGKGQSGIFGNPFWMNDESKRDDVCDKFQIHFENKMNNKSGELYEGVKGFTGLQKKKRLGIGMFLRSKKMPL